MKKCWPFFHKYKRLEDLWYRDPECPLQYGGIMLVHAKQCTKCGHTKRWMWLDGPIVGLFSMGCITRDTPIHYRNTKGVYVQVPASKFFEYVVQARGGVI